MAKAVVKKRGTTKGQQKICYPYFRRGEDWGEVDTRYKSRAEVQLIGPAGLPGEEGGLGEADLPLF